MSNITVDDQSKKIDELSQIKFVPGFEESVGYFPLLENLSDKPVLARFSYGSKALNMSTSFFDSTRGESEVTTQRNRREFLKSQGFLKDAIQVRGRFEGTEAQIEEVSLETLADKSIVTGNMVLTRDPRITLFILPADCPTVILYAKDKLGHDLIAIDHCGAEAVNAGITRQGLLYLKGELGVDLSTTVAGVFPGVAQKNYFITNEPEQRGNGIIDKNWGPFITPRKTQDPSEKRHVDILSAFEMQAIQAGVKPENLQAYRRNTYLDAASGFAFSRRYTSEHDGERPGANLLAVRLNNTPQELLEHDELASS